jgi:hypothetical protein
LGNDIGSAGFNGFDDRHAALENVRYVTGGHDAFLRRIHEIASLLNAPLPTRVAEDADFRVGDQVRMLRWASAWGNWLVVWPLLAATVLFVGWHVTVSATEPRWPMVVAYLAIVLLILSKA